MLLDTSFQLTRLMRGVTLISFSYLLARRIFQLTRLMRGVTPKQFLSLERIPFQLTRLMRGVTLNDFYQCSCLFYFNSHASCEA